MKRAVIQYIIHSPRQQQSQDYYTSGFYKRGLQILQQLNPYHRLISSSYTPANQKELIKTLGHHLRTNQLQPVPDTSPQVITKEEIKTTSPATDTPPPPEEFTEPAGSLSTEARLNMDIARMIKILRAQSMKLQQAQSDHERKIIYAECNRVNSCIEQSKALLRQLQQGTKVNYVNTYFEAEDESDFDLPEKLIDVDKKYRSMMQKRSKRLAKAEQKKATHGLDSPQHQQALAEWKHFDEVVKHLKTRIDELTHTSS